MPLDAYFADRFDAFARFLTGEAEEPAAPEAPPVGDDVHVRDVEIAGRHGPIRVRTYEPAGEVTAALLWAHGGGFRHGDLDMPEGHWVSAELARRAGAFVASVDYRLAVGGVRHPVPIDDVHAAWSWLTSDDTLPERRAIGGASAGAALALATALRVRDRGERRPEALLLAYPFTHFPNPAPAPDAAAELSATLPPFARFTPTGVEEMVRNYVGRITDLPPDALPGAARLSGLAPVYLVLSEFDDLRLSGELLARQLEEARVDVSTFLARDMPHGHLNHAVDIPGVTESLRYFAEALTIA